MFAGNISNLNRAISLGVAAVLSFAALLPLSGVAHAAGIDGFDQNDLISDQAMYGDVADSLSVEEIQAFLNAKGAKCSRGKDGSACLKDARFDVPSFPASRFCEREFVGGNGQSAAQVIANASRACRVSPKVLIVLLQKEQGLVTSQNPTQRNYARATGFACPDTAPCDPAKAGFATQVYSAASRLQQYRLEPHRFNFAVGRTSNIGYHPKKECGGTTVTPKSAATAALYNYTPYVPNAAALANPYGEGDKCSAYGNRNFYRLHSDWFGQPNLDSGSGAQTPPPAPQSPAPQPPAPPQQTPPSVNNEPIRVTAENLTIAGQAPLTLPQIANNTFPIGNWDGHALEDVAHVLSNGDLFLYSHATPTSYVEPRRIGQGWHRMKFIRGGIDWDGNGTSDIIAVDNHNRMILYRGTGNSGFGAISHIGNGWGSFEQILLVPSGPHGRPAVIASGNGGSYVYPTDGRGGWRQRSATNLPSLRDAIIAPDIWGSGYSMLILPESHTSIAFYSTKDGATFARSGHLNLPDGYSTVVNASRVPGRNEMILDVLNANRTATSITLAMTKGNTAVPAPPPAPVPTPPAPAPAPPTPPAPPAPPASSGVPPLWSGAKYSGASHAGNGWPSSHVYSMGDFDGDGNVDAAIMWADGRLVLYPSNAHGTAFRSARQIGAGWHTLKDFHTGVDFDGDTRPDVIGRTRNGELRLYPGNGRGGFAKPRQIGAGWNMFDTIKVLRQGPKGKPVVVGVSGDRIRLYPTDGRGAFLTPFAWSSGFPWAKHAIASDDWNNDGQSDLLYQAPDGMLYVAQQNATAFAQPSQARIGSGWQGFSRLIPAHFDAAQKSLWVIDGQRKLLVFTWKSKLGQGSFAPTPRVR